MGLGVFVGVGVGDGPKVGVAVGVFVGAVDACWLFVSVVLLEVWATAVPKPPIAQMTKMITNQMGRATFRVRAFWRRGRPPCGGYPGGPGGG